LIINGLPASGKTTLGAALSPLLGLPIFSKDTLKEIIFDHVGWESRSWSQRVGQAAWDLLWMITERELQADRSIAIESNFLQPVADARLAAFRVSMRFRVVELHCTADREVVIDRFIERAQSGDRHPGHREAEPEQLYGDFIPRLRDADDPLLTMTEGSLCIDTTVLDQLDIPAIAARLRALLWPQSAGWEPGN
jgi:predicted kinase